MACGGGGYGAVGEALALAGQPDGVADMEEMDVLLGDSLDLLESVGAGDGVDSLALVDDMDKILLAAHSLDLVRHLHGLAAWHLGPDAD